MKIKKQVLIVIGALLLLPLYQNCGKKMSFTNMASSVGTDGIGDVIPDCHNTQLSTKDFAINLPKPSGCAWNQDGNLGPRDTYLQARVVQTTDLDLPNNAILCDMEFNFQEQPFQYDDHVILALNNRILTSTTNFSNMLSHDDSGLLYDWPTMVGKPINVGATDVYCNGEFSTCIFPNTQQAGRILLQFPKAVIQQIVVSSARPVNQIEMITTGDNDNSTDCQHDPIAFSIRAHYVVGQ